MLENEEIEVEEELPQPEEAVLEELGLNDDTPSEPTEKELIEQKLDELAEGKPEDPPKPENTEISEDDLRPLDSKNPRTNERFEKLTNGFKEAKAEVETLRNEIQRYETEAKQYKQSFEALQQLGFTDQAGAQDLIALAHYRQALGRGDEATFKKMIADQVRQFEAMHGKKISIQASALDQFQDLKQRVDGGELDDNTALELAKHRALQQRLERQQQEQYQQYTQQQQTQERLSQAVQHVESLQQQWQATDPDFPAILPHLQAKMTEIGSQFPPEAWPRIIALQYDSLKSALVNANAQRNTHTLPLRGNSRVAGRPSPSSPTEAVLQELGLDD